MKSILKIAFFSFALLIHSPGYGEDKISHSEKEGRSGVTSLSAELRGLLTKEMLALQGGMIAIIPAYVSGNWSEIESIAGTMKNSFILKQSLTDRQLKELHTSLPASFMKLDQQFHYLAGMLEHVAKSKKPELVGFYFSKMSETCVSCHTQYATHKFPALLPEKEASEHAH